MEKRQIEKLGVETSLLGFGCMRFPTLPDGKIDEAEAVKMMDAAYAAGVNYFDTAYPYHNGDSEPFVGKYLDTKPRDSYYLATKLPVWEINSVADAEAMFEKQLKRLNKDYVDFYLLHALDREKFTKMRDLGVVEFGKKLKAEGKVKFFGFSFHDSYEAFEEIINYTDWDFCQIQYNYMDVADQPGDRGYELAADKNIPLVIMEPIRGGMLAKLPEDIRGKFIDKNASDASYALRFVASRPNVKVVLSGMSTMDNVMDNLNTFNNFVPYSEEEEAMIKDVRESIQAKVRNKCTGCRYCVPCPAGVKIPDNFRVWNEYSMYENKGSLQWNYSNLTKENGFADKCVQCGLCETKCPQKINIREDLKTLCQEITSKLA